MNSDRHRTGERVGRRRADAGEVRDGVGERDPAGGDREDRVTVERGMNRVDRPRQTVLCHHREAAGLSLGQVRVGGDDGQGGAAAGQSLNTWLVAMVRSATNEHAINVDIDLSSVPFVGYDPFAANRKQGNNRRMTGWL